MAGRREYQDDAVAVFRSLGLEVGTDSTVADLEVRGRDGGLDQLWVVACEHRRRQVAEVHVAALARVVADAGADRGFLLSEVSFQAGARRAAYGSGVILSSLADLRAHAATELLSVRLDDGRRRLSRLLERVNVLRRAGGPADGVRSLWTFVETAQDGVAKVDADVWPAPFGVDRERGRPVYADDLASFVAGLAGALDEHETLLAELTNDPDAPPR